MKEVFVLLFFVFLALSLQGMFLSKARNRIKQLEERVNRIEILMDIEK